MPGAEANETVMLKSMPASLIVRAFAAALLSIPENL
jgi:hypothetical protein